MCHFPQIHSTFFSLQNRAVLPRTPTNTAYQVAIRLSTYPHINAEPEGKHPKEQAKDNSLLLNPTRISSDTNITDAEDLLKTCISSVIADSVSMNLYMPCLVDSVGHILIMYSTIVTRAVLHHPHHLWWDARTLQILWVSESVFFITKFPQIKKRLTSRNQVICTESLSIVLS